MTRLCSSTPNSTLLTVSDLLHLLAAHSRSSLQVQLPGRASRPFQGYTSLLRGECSVINRLRMYLQCVQSTRHAPLLQMFHAIRKEFASSGAHLRVLNPLYYRHSCIIQEFLPRRSLHMENLYFSLHLCCYSIIVIDNFWLFGHLQYNLIEVSLQMYVWNYVCYVYGNPLDIPNVILELSICIHS